MNQTKNTSIISHHLHDIKEDSSEWIELSSELSSSLSWTYESSRPRAASAIATAISNEDPQVDQAMEKLQRFYDVQQNRHELDHHTLYRAFQQAFHKHATAKVFAFGTPLSDMGNPELLSSYTCDGVYFEMFRPGTSSVRIVATSKLYAQVGMFQYTTQEEYAGRIVMRRYNCVAREGQVFRLEHEETIVHADRGGDQEESTDQSTVVSVESSNSKKTRKSRSKVQQVITWAKKYSHSC